jgi:hypothetical protein
MIGRTLVTSSSCHGYVLNSCGGARRQAFLLHAPGSVFATGAGAGQLQGAPAIAVVVKCSNTDTNK